MTTETTQEAPAKLWCDNPEHAEAGSAVSAIYRVSWPDGRFRPALACKDCLEDSLSLYVLNGDSDGRRHPVLIELAVPVAGMPLWVTATLADRKARKLIESWEPVPGRGIVVVGADMAETELRSEHDARLFLAGISSSLTAFHDGEARR